MYHQAIEDQPMARKRKTSREKRELKAVKRLARRMRVPPTRVQTSKSKRKQRKRSRTLEEHLKEQGWI
jgi:hypothetical protein